MTEAVDLPFSSQQQLLARLLHLSRLDTDFILLTGPEGAGKSHLAARLVDSTELLLPALLDAEALDANARFRDALLTTWFPGGIFAAEDPLPASMVRLLAGSPGKRLLAVDNAEWLPEDLLLELARLHRELPAGARPFMVLLGAEQWAGETRRLLEGEAGGKVLEVEVPPLTVEDRQALWQALGYQETHEAVDDILYPGDVMGMMEPQMKIPGYQQLLEQKTTKILLTALILVVLLIIIVSLLGGDRQAAAPEPVPPSQRESLPAAPAASLTLGEEVPAGAEPLPTDGNTPVRDWPAEPLPATPEISTKVAETPDDSDKERVVIEDEVVSRLMQRGQEPQAAPATRQTSAAAVTPSPAPGSGLSPLSALTQKSASRYTLQLMAGRDRAALARLATRHTLTPAWIYPRTINDQSWFVLVFGDFATPEQARQAIGSLPAELRAAKPWPKPFGQVQKEVKP
ncbi:SPOR domain-containing protein [Zobellella sp. An-6]|uniref:SPOR domain-containing protein n=1 Tax=Zobellella sp. An-6 TaxID=3400218 RepID=UPI004042CF6A